jgi:hypothetical protein
LADQRGATGIFLKIQKDARILKYELEVEHIVVTMVVNGIFTF